MDNEKTRQVKGGRKTIDPTDIRVGQRIRRRRNLIGMSQTMLADGLGVTFQQVQKYENGTNRVSASRLQAMAEILGVPIGYFFAVEDGGLIGATIQDGDEADPAESNELTTFIGSAEGLKLNRAFARIDDAKTRRSLIALVKALG